MWEFSRHNVGDQRSLPLPIIIYGMITPYQLRQLLVMLDPLFGLHSAFLTMHLLFYACHSGSLSWDRNRVPSADSVLAARIRTHWVSLLHFLHPHPANLNPPLLLCAYAKLNHLPRLGGALHIFASKIQPRSALWVYLPSSTILWQNPSLEHFAKNLCNMQDTLPIITSSSLICTSLPTCFPRDSSFGPLVVVHCTTQSSLFPHTDKIWLTVWYLKHRSLHLGIWLIHPCSSVCLSTSGWLDFTANIRTEGTDKIFLFWDIFKELSVTQPVLHRFGWNLGRSVQAQLVVGRDLWKYYILGNLCFWTISMPNAT
jgi:hypothetical protein